MMKHRKYFLFGFAFFLLAALVIRLSEPPPPLFSSTQVSGTKHSCLYEGIVNGLLVVQEITLTKDYLNGIEIGFGTMGKVNTNTNTILVLDSNYNLLHQEKFSSREIENSKFHSFQFKESKKAGKGNKIYICIFSRDGDSTNCIHAFFVPDSKLGNLYTSIVMNDDIIRSIKYKTRIYPGSLILRTYESDSSFSSAIRMIWYIVAALIAFLIMLLKRIQSFLIRLNIRVEIVYVAIALIFGPFFVFLNPPFQVPDEWSHYSRTVELSEFHFSKTGKTIPASIYRLDSAFGRLHFNPDEKTSKNEILSMAKVNMKPTVRKESSGPDYIVPYLPQILGLVIGKMFSSAPLVLLYFGRFFNLILAILIVFLAIRITPFSKWIFFLLALMPKTMFLMASVSYDAFVISSSFLLIALYLYYAFKAEKLIWRDIGLLFLLSVLLALCKPPYFIIGFLFLIIPLRKIGSLIKYATIFMVISITMFLAQGTWSMIGGLIKPADAIKTEQVTQKGLPVKTISNAPATQTPTTQAAATQTPATHAPAPSRPEINPPKQLDYIRSHLPAFINLLIATNFDYMRADMLNNFVGTMGWLDTFLPDIYVNIYLILLLITALCIPDPAFYIDWNRKALFFILFIAGILAIETAMYIYSSFVAQERLFGIQGRYFIPLAPLFLLIFYNNSIAEKLNYTFSPRRKSWLKAKPNLKSKILLEIKKDQMFTKYLQVFIIVFTVVTLIRSIAAIMLRYYQW
jgi:uncharacterized membrane protein